MADQEASAREGSTDGSATTAAPSERDGLFRAVMDVLAAAIYTTDAEGYLTYFNPAAVELAGRVPQLGTDQWCVTWKIYLPDGTLLPLEQCTMAVALKEGRIVHGTEAIVERPDGTRIWVTPYPRLLRDAQGKILGGVNMLVDITARKEAEAIAKESEFSARLLQLQDEERRRIARELHDGVGQLIAAMSLYAARVAREKSKLTADGARCMDETLNLVGEASKEIRTVSYLLHPPLLDEMGLQSALKWYVSGFAERSKIAAKLEVLMDLGRLPREYELCLFRITQECLTNIHRHSGSSTAVVRMWRGAGEIKLEVRDEGCGVNRETQLKISSGKSSGVGVRGMRERLRLLGGTLRMNSNAHGTTITVALPLKESTLSVVDSATGYQPLPEGAFEAGSVDSNLGVNAVNQTARTKTVRARTRPGSLLPSGDLTTTGTES